MAAMCDLNELKDLLCKEFQAQSIFEARDGLARVKENCLRGRVLPISGRLIRTVSARDLIESYIRPVLPKDAISLQIGDDEWFRMSPGMHGRGADEFCIFFASQEWEPIPEGGSFPRMESLHLHKPVCDNPIEPRATYILSIGQSRWEATDGERSYSQRGASTTRDSDYEIVVDKHTHFIETPKDLEDGHHLVIRIKSKE